MSIGKKLKMRKGGGGGQKKIKRKEIRILVREKATERKNSRWEERWGSGEGKEKRGGGEAAKGRSVENCTSAHVRLILRDDRRLTAEIKTTPRIRLSRSFHLFQPLILSFCFLLSFPHFSSLLGGLSNPPPFPPLSRLITQHNIHAQPPSPVCSHQGVFPKAVNHVLKTRCIGGKTLVYCVCMWVPWMQLIHTNQSWITFTQCSN